MKLVTGWGHITNTPSQRVGGISEDMRPDARRLLRVNRKSLLARRNIAAMYRQLPDGD